ncbi:probable assembly chaperone of rpl4 [Bufo bufo]|uniref:probable assembly chaperone of rpl4 n=1 Tax=Bufo bufo TaxID=8384 RepID=UPI001ABE67C4|nr:probable assembly chaperone of rpl4 [Bufo bufo]
MGGQAKRKSNKRRQRGRTAVDVTGLSAQDRMKIRMQNKAKKKTAEKYSVHQLLEKTAEYLDNLNFEMAQIFCQRALDLEPENLEILDMMGNICMELGNAVKAKQVLLKAVELSPDKGHAKYMCLGQIHCKEEALQYFQKGIEVMIRAYQSQPQVSGAANFSDEMEVTTKDISTAFCSVAEIHLTDLCMEEGAGDKCKEALTKALEYQPHSPEALQLMASYLFSMEQPQEGKEYLMKSLASWLPSLQKSEAPVQEPDEDDLVESKLPAYECRISTAKLLIEAENFELATEVLEGLLEEDDEVIQVWYLLGWVCYLQAKESDEEEEDAFKDSARTYLRKAKKLYSKLRCDDSALLEHVQQILGELGEDEAPGNSDGEDAPLENIEDNFVQSSEEEVMEA